MAGTENFLSILCHQLIAFMRRRMVGVTDVGLRRSFLRLKQFPDLTQICVCLFGTTGFLADKQIPQHSTPAY